MAKDKLEWSSEKNDPLKRQRGLCFEDVETAIETGDYIEDLPHPNLDRYPNQRMLIVEIDGYVCAVPYVRNGNTRFLKTIFRSRKLKRLFTK
ncbi:hypothetical protein MNBD_ALPHA04-2095 [hydrothermal vent metagenome]|uniref:Toxin n=1 Tax=hydrothermal vent metagenome TaxID=652676 RepID=A0A3B0T4S3_9ZZZZ